VSCDVRHGASYAQRRADGSINAQQLKSLVNNRVARLQALGGNGGLSTDSAPPAVGSLAFWGRGIGGDLEISIPGSRLNADLNLSGLTEPSKHAGPDLVVERFVGTFLPSGPCESLFEPL